VKLYNTVFITAVASGW